MTLQHIHEALLNGQRKQMVEQIQEYGLYEFWGDYKDYLADRYSMIESQYAWFTDCVTSFNHIVYK